MNTLEDGAGNIFFAHTLENFKARIYFLFSCFKSLKWISRGGGRSGLHFTGKRPDKNIRQAKNRLFSAVNDTFSTSD